MQQEEGLSMFFENKTFAQRGKEIFEATMRV